jgi:hypothetical protein
MERSRILYISEDYFKELLDYTSKSLVGKLLKRFEIIENKDIIKADAKELIYEEFRQLRDLVIAHTKGLDLTQFVFKKPGENSTSK